MQHKHPIFFNKRNDLIARASVCLADAKDPDSASFLLMAFAALPSVPAYKRTKQKMLWLLDDAELEKKPEDQQDNNKWMQRASFKAQMWGRILLAAQSMNDAALVDMACEKIEVFLSQINLNTEDKDELARITLAMAHYAAYSLLNYRLYKDIILSCAERLNRLDSSAARQDALWSWILFLQAAARAGDRETYDSIKAKMARDETIVTVLSRLSHTHQSNALPAMAKVQWAAAIIGDNELFLALQEPIKKSAAEVFKTPFTKAEDVLGIVEKNLAILANSKTRDDKQKKFEQAIVDGHFKLVDHSLKNKRSNHRYRLAIHSSDLEIVLDGEKRGIRLDQFLLKNDWYKTLVAVRGERDDNNSYTEISYEEQKAVRVYVGPEDAHVALKKYFDPKATHIFRESCYPDSVRQKYAAEINDTLERIQADLKTLICMQSAFNKARIKYPHASEEVYRDISSVRLPREMTHYEKLTTGSGVVEAISVVSTARRESEHSDQPPPIYPMSRRDTRFVILRGSDAMPLALLINKQKYPDVWRGVLESERENFLGIRPAFFVRKDFTDKQDKEKNPAIRFQYTLQHITSTDRDKIAKVQNLRRINNLSERHNKPLQIQIPATNPSTPAANQSPSPEVEMKRSMSFTGQVEQTSPRRRMTF